LVSFRYRFGGFVLLALLALPAPAPAQGRPAPPPPAAGEPETPEWLQRLERWSVAVVTHEPGKLDTAAVELSAWTADDLTTVVDDYLALSVTLRKAAARRGSPFAHKKLRLTARDLLKHAVFREEQPGDALRVLRRAAMLHADVALLAPYDLSKSTGARVTVTVLDGIVVGHDGVSAHWAAGRRLLDAVEPAPAADVFVRLWYHAVAAALLEDKDLSSAKPHLEHALTVLPRDANVQYENGYYHQAHTQPSVEAVMRIQERMASTLNRSRSQGVPVPETIEFHHKQAERSFKQAIALDPGHVEARVRLGMTLLQLDKVSDAAGYLRDAAGDGGDPTLFYFAQLLQGQAEERLGRPQEAAASYARAAALVPDAKSPQFALAALDRSQGAREKAWALAKPAVEPPMQEQLVADPWWSFYTWQSKPAKQLLAELRALSSQEVLK
jgi:tetratricopeptide (TPR) repeat protein